MDKLALLYLLASLTSYVSVHVNSVSSILLETNVYIPGRTFTVNSTVSTGARDLLL